MLYRGVENYGWQTDSELTRLDAAPLLTATFPQYLAAFLEELRYSSSKRRTFAIETGRGKHIGNCSYYDINEKKGEVQLGIMIGNRKYWDKGYGTVAVTRLLDLIFEETDLNRVYLKTLVSNIRAHKCFQKCGFSHSGHLVKGDFQFVLMDITRARWQELHPKDDEK